MKIKFKILALLSVILLNHELAKACQCPLSSLSLEECNKYEIIFKGRIVRVKNCENKLGEALFKIEELYKGNAEENFKVLFECGVECAQNFREGDEWIIYSRYKQIDNAQIDWCSRSRKFFKNDNEDFYVFSHGNDYEDEVAFLQKNLGLHRVMTEQNKQINERNIKPNIAESVFVVLISLGCIILFYYLFNRFFK